VEIKIKQNNNDSTSDLAARRHTTHTHTHTRARRDRLKLFYHSYEPLNDAHNNEMMIIIRLYDSLAADRETFRSGIIK
jgi:hypothetical protein